MRFKNGAEKMRWYKTTVNGHITLIYSHQKRNCVTRNHPMPTYTRDELLNRSLNDPEYMTLHNEWVDAGCPKRLSPSYDRIDNDLSYTMDNIRITTWEKNEQRSRDEMRAGIITNNTNPQVKTLQYTTENVFIEEYHSMQEASRITGVPASNICRVCMGDRNTAGGFIWKYAT